MTAVLQTQLLMLLIALMTSSSSVTTVEVLFFGPTCLLYPLPGDSERNACHDNSICSLKQSHYIIITIITKLE